MRSFFCAYLTGFVVEISEITGLGRFRACKGQRPASTAKWQLPFPGLLNRFYSDIAEFDWTTLALQADVARIGICVLADILQNAVNG